MRNLLKVLALGGLVFASAASPASAQQYRLRLAHALAPTEPIHIVSEEFAKAVAERSKGRVQIQVFPSEQLGINKDMLEQVRQGAPIIQLADAGFMSDYVPDFGVLNGPYLIDGPDDFKKLLKSDWYAKLKESSEKAGLRPIAFNFFFGTRHMLGNKPFRKPEDLNGVTTRIAPNPIWVETFKALGARGVPLPWTEVYGALAQNVVDAVEAPMASLTASKLQEQRKVLSTTGHFTQFVGYVISDKIFRGYPQDIQQILVEEAEKAGEKMTQVTIANDAKLIESLKAQGVTVVADIDRPAFKEATKSVYGALPRWSPGLYPMIQKILAN